MMQDKQKEFIKLLNRLADSGHRNVFDVFRDAVGAMACACEQLSLHAEEREARYKSIMEGYGKDERETFAEAFSVVVEGLECRRTSFLGPVLEEIGAANVRNGQFLTPAAVSDLMARVTAPDAAARHRPGEVVTLHDPACGAGVLMISQAEYLVKEGVPPRDIYIVTGDVDMRGCDITFVELTLLGYAARVEQRNALTMQLMSPPRYTSAYYMYGTQWREKGWLNGL